MNEIFPFVIAWMNCEDTVINKINQIKANII